MNSVDLIHISTVVDSIRNGLLLIGILGILGLVCFLLVGGSLLLNQRRIMRELKIPEKEIR